jgi:glutaredoxin
MKYVILTREGCDFCALAKALIGAGSYVEIGGVIAQSSSKKGVQDLPADLPRRQAYRRL